MRSTSHASRVSVFVKPALYDWLDRPVEHVLPAGEEAVRSIVHSRHARGDGQRVGVSELERPWQVVDMAAEEPASSVSRVETIPLGQPVFQRSRQRVPDIAGRLIGALERCFPVGPVRSLQNRTTGPCSANVIGAWK
jgi:hypothetical protein